MDALAIFAGTPAWAAALGVLLVLFLLGFIGAPLGAWAVAGLVALVGFGAPVWAVALFAGLALVFLTITLALQTLRWQPLVITALGFFVALSAYFWISAPTKEGRALLDRIAGFKQYLSITERERLDRMLSREGRVEFARACFDFLPTRARLDLAGWAETDIFAHS